MVFILENLMSTPPSPEHCTIKQRGHAEMFEKEHNTFANRDKPLNTIGRFKYGCLPDGQISALRQVPPPTWWLLFLGLLDGYFLIPGDFFACQMAKSPRCVKSPPPPLGGCYSWGFWMATS